MFPCSVCFFKIYFIHDEATYSDGAIVSAVFSPNIHSWMNQMSLWVNTVSCIILNRAMTNSQMAQIYFHRSSTLKLHFFAVTEFREFQGDTKYSQNYTFLGSAKLILVNFFEFFQENRLCHTFTSPPDWLHWTWIQYNCILLAIWNWNAKAAQRKIVKKSYTYIPFYHCYQWTQCEIIF